MMRFEYQFEEGAEKVVIELPAQATLEEALDAFRRFLLAATYCFKGEVIIYDSHLEPLEDTDKYDGFDGQ
jgi:hypothetical protein